MSGLSVDNGVQATIILSLEQGVKEWEGSILPHFYSEFDGWLRTVKVAQESFSRALPHDVAGAVDVPLPEPGLHWAVLSASSSKTSM